MTVREALLASKENGHTYSRVSNTGFVGWICWNDTTMYRLSAEDLVAEDWEPSSKVIEALTDGAYTVVEGDQ